MISGTEISLAPLAAPHVAIPGKLLSLGGRYAELTLESDTPLSPGSLVQFQTQQMLYLGEIESGSPEKLRVLIEHSVDLERAGAIRRLWHTDNE